MGPTTLINILTKDSSPRNTDLLQRTGSSCLRSVDEPSVFFGTFSSGCPFRCHRQNSTEVSTNDNRLHYFSFSLCLSENRWQWWTKIVGSWDYDQNIIYRTAQKGWINCTYHGNSTGSYLSFQSPSTQRFNILMNLPENLPSRRPVTQQEIRQLNMNLIKTDSS